MASMRILLAIFVGAWLSTQFDSHLFGAPGDRYQTLSESNVSMEFVFQEPTTNLGSVQRGQLKIGDSIEFRYQYHVANDTTYFSGHQTLSDGKKVVGSGYVKGDILIANIKLGSDAERVEYRASRIWLIANDADHNTREIQQRLADGKEVFILAGRWKVRPIALPSGSRLRGEGLESELQLVLDTPPERFDPQHVLATARPSVPGEFTEDIQIRDLTINGNVVNNDWSRIYNDGNAHGILFQATKNCRVENVEIKNCRTDGIMITTILGTNTNCDSIVCEKVSIHHAARQGVSIVGGENVQLKKFTVSDIGRDELRVSPRSALDLEPNPNAQQFVRNVSVTDWKVDRCGQGILATGYGSSEQMENVTIKNVTVRDLDGPQVLAMRDIDGFEVEDISFEEHSGTSGLGLFFKDAVGSVSNISLKKIPKISYPFQVRGDSEIVFDGITLEDLGRGALHVGSEPNEAASATKVTLKAFSIRDVNREGFRYVPVRVNSTELVQIENATLTGIGLAFYTLQLVTDTTFTNCDFAKGSKGYFVPDATGKAHGVGNSWNVQAE